MHEVAGSRQGLAPADVARRALDRVRASSMAVDAAIVSGVALVVGLIQLGSPSLWIDEALTAEEITWRYSRSLEGLYWLYYTIEKPWAVVAGYSEWSLRLPSVVATMLSGVLTIILARRLSFDRRVALLSGLFLVTSPFVVKWSQQARGYTMMLALSLLATILLVRALERGSRAAFALYGLSVAAIFVWHPVGGLVLALPHLVLMAQRRERLLPHGLLAAAVVLAIGVPWSAQVTMRSAGESAVMSWLQYPTLETVARGVLDISGAGWFGIVLALVGLAVLWRASQRDRATWLAVWAFSPFAVVLVVSIVQPIFLDRYLIAAAPAFALLAAVAVTGVARRLGTTLLVVAAATTILALVQWYAYPATANWRGEDWRSAVTALRAESGGDDVLVVPWWAHVGAAYYGASPASTATTDSVWVLTWSETGHRLPRAERLPLGLGEHELLERQDFGRRVSLQHWVRRE